MRKLRQWLLPPWALPEHPLLQYELSHHRANNRRSRFFAQLITISVLFAGFAALYAATLLHPASGDNLTGVIWQSVYYPTLALQQLTAIVALMLGAASVGGERSRNTWDNLRATEFGAELALRARWAGILYRLRAPIAVILLTRFILIAGMLYDLTAFAGFYPQMLGAQATPPLPAWRLDLLLIALAVTVTILLPCVQIAAIAAFGILLSVAVRERIYAAVIQILVAAIQLAFAAAGALAIAHMLRAEAPVSGAWSYALFFGYSTFGDWGLLLAQLGSLGEIWHRAPYGSTISMGLVVPLFALGLAADGAIWLAARLSESRG